VFLGNMQFNTAVRTAVSKFVQAVLQAIQQFSIVSGFFQQVVPLSQAIQAQFRVIFITMQLLVLSSLWRFTCKFFEGMKRSF
jgi:hypothetical protein